MQIDLTIKTKNGSQLILPWGESAETYKVSVECEMIPDRIIQVLTKTVVVADGIECDNAVRLIRQAMGTTIPHIYEKETRDFMISLHVTE